MGTEDIVVIRKKLQDIVDEKTDEASFSSGNFAHNGWSAKQITNYALEIGFDGMPTVDEFNAAFDKFRGVENIDLSSRIGKIAMRKILSELASNNEINTKNSESNNERISDVNNSYKKAKSLTRLVVPRPGEKISNTINTEITHYLQRPSDFIDSLEKKDSSVYLSRIHFFDLPFDKKRIGGAFVELGRIEGVMSSNESLMGINPVKFGVGVSKIVDPINKSSYSQFFNLLDVDIRMVGLFSPEDEKCVDYNFGFFDPETCNGYEIKGLTAGSYDVIKDRKLNLPHITSNITFGNRIVKENFKRRYGNFKEELEFLSAKHSNLRRGHVLLSLQPKVLDDTGDIQVRTYSTASTPDISYYLKKNVIKEYGVNLVTPKIIMEKGKSEEKDLLWNVHAITLAELLYEKIDKILYSNGVKNALDILDDGKGVYFNDVKIGDGINELLKNLLNTY